MKEIDELMEVKPEVIAMNTKLAFAKHKNDAGMLGAYYHLLQRQKSE
jgi:predicted NBD/HSP70 family sugar kinase